MLLLSETETQKYTPTYSISKQEKFFKLHLYWRSKQWHFHTSSKPQQINCLTEQKPISSIRNIASYCTYSVKVFQKCYLQYAFICVLLTWMLCQSWRKCSSSCFWCSFGALFVFFLRSYEVRTMYNVLCKMNLYTETQQLACRLPGDKNKHDQTKTPYCLETWEKLHPLSNFQFLDWIWIIHYLHQNYS